MTVTNSRFLVLLLTVMYFWYHSDFVRGIGKPPPEIDNAACRRLLRRSVAGICAHAGVEGKSVRLILLKIITLI